MAMSSKEGKIYCKRKTYKFCRYAELSKNNILFEPLADYAAVCGSKIRIKYMLKV